MARLLPSTSDAEAPDAEPRVVGLDSDDADELLSALSSGTARRLLSALHEKPDTPSGVADRIETSLQNAQYHLGKLEDADLVEVADTVYSEKGREMRVYAPSDAPLVVFAGRDDERTGLKAALLRLLGGVGVLGLASVAVQRLLAPPGALSGTDSGAAPTAGGGGDAAEEDGNGASDEGAAADGGGGDGDGGDTADGGNGDDGGAGGDAEDDGGFTIQKETESAAETSTGSGTATPTETAGDAATEAATSEPAVTEAAASAADSTVDAAMALEPGVLFFLGGALVLALAFAVWFYGYRTR